MPQNNIERQADYIPLIVLGGVLLYYRKALTQHAQNDRKVDLHLWIPIVSQLLQFSITSALQRVRENSQRELHHIALQTGRMNELYSQGMHFLKEGDYIRAADTFMMSRKIFESLEMHGIDPILKDQYAVCCYHEAYARYHLHQYDKAEAIIELTSKYPIMSQVVKADLLNLQGLIFFINHFLFAFREDKREAEGLSLFLDKAKKSFTESLSNVRKQPNVEIFLCYLNHETQFLVNNLPFEDPSLCEPQEDSAIQVDERNILSTFMPFLFAEACVKENKIELAIHLYRLHIESTKPSTGMNEFFEAFIVRFRCLEAYEKLTTKSRSDDAGFAKMKDEVEKYLTHPLLPRDFNSNNARKMYEQACAKLNINPAPSVPQAVQSMPMPKKDEGGFRKAAFAAAISVAGFCLWKRPFSSAPSLLPKPSR